MIVRVLYYALSFIVFIRHVIITGNTACYIIGRNCTGNNAAVYNITCVNSGNTTCYRNDHIVAACILIVRISDINIRKYKVFDCSFVFEEHTGKSSVER